MNTLSLSVSNPSRAKGSSLRNSLSTSVSSRCSRTESGALRPACGDVSQHQGLHEAALRHRPTMRDQIRPTNPGGGSSPPSNVRSGTLRLTAADGAALQRVAFPACLLMSRNARSMVAALIARRLVRTSCPSRRWSCRSIASTRTGTRGRSRLPQIWSNASQITISASRTALS
jgi:hypothetical protein